MRVKMKKKLASDGHLLIISFIFENFFLSRDLSFVFRKLIKVMLVCQFHEPQNELT